MGEYFILANNFLWNEIAFALELCTADVVGDSFEKAGYQQLKSICEEYGAIKTIECLMDCLKQDYSYAILLG